MRWPKALVLVLGFICGPAGCRNNDLVEAELRTRERELRTLKGDLDRAEYQNEALMHELASVRQGTSSKLTPEQASQLYTLKQISLGRGTGGYSDGHGDGDEGLQIVLEPRDADDHPIKVPGTLHLVAFEISREGLKVPLSAWDVPPEELHRKWHSGLFSTGYTLVLPWKTAPASEKLRVLAQFKLLDGRVFETDKDVTIRLPSLPHPRPLQQPNPLDNPEPVIPEPPAPLPGAAQSQTTSTSSWRVPSSGGRQTPEPLVQWRPKAEGSLADAVQLFKPTKLSYEPGEEP